MRNKSERICESEQCKKYLSRLIQNSKNIMNGNLGKKDRNSLVLVWISKTEMFFVKKINLLKPVSAILKRDLIVIHLDMMDDKWLPESYIPRYCLNILREHGSLEGCCDLSQIIFEARKQLLEEMNKECPYFKWIKLLFVTHKFGKEIKGLFWDSSNIMPDVNKFYKLNGEAKSMILELINTNDITPDKEHFIVVQKRQEMEFPDVYVGTKNSRIKRELSEFSLRELIKMDIRNEKKEEERILVVIYCYILYPIRMKRLRLKKYQEYNEAKEYKFDS